MRVVLADELLLHKRKYEVVDAPRTNSIIWNGLLEGRCSVLTPPTELDREVTSRLVAGDYPDLSHLGLGPGRKQGKHRREVRRHNRRKKG